jgi:hypothetical protein
VISGIAASSGSLGALFFIPTVFVPLLMITHGLIFWLLAPASRRQVTEDNPGRAA